jgi:hypothetical protein
VPRVLRGRVTDEMVVGEGKKKLVVMEKQAKHNINKGKWKRAWVCRDKGVG